MPGIAIQKGYDAHSGTWRAGACCVAGSPFSLLKQKRLLKAAKGRRGPSCQGKDVGRMER